MREGAKLENELVGATFESLERLLLLQSGAENYRSRGTERTRKASSLKIMEDV